MKNDPLAPYKSEHELLMEYYKRRDSGGIRSGGIRKRKMPSQQVKVKMTFSLTLGVTCLVLSLLMFIKLNDAVYQILSLNGSLFSPQVIVYVLGLLMLMFAAGIFLAPTIRALRKNYELSKKRTKNTT